MTIHSKHNSDITSYFWHWADSACLHQSFLLCHNHWLSSEKKIQKIFFNKILKIIFTKFFFSHNTLIFSKIVILTKTNAHSHFQIVNSVKISMEYSERYCNFQILQKTPLVKISLAINEIGKCQPKQKLNKHCKKIPGTSSLKITRSWLSKRNFLENFCFIFWIIRY